MVYVGDVSQHQQSIAGSEDLKGYVTTSETQTSEYIY